MTGMSLRSFSGTHEFNPVCLMDYDKDTVDRVTEDVEAGRCPRCWGALPVLPEFPAGSRVTQCRCIPICGMCGSDEVYEAIDADTGYGFGMSAPDSWPLVIDEIDQRRERYEKQLKPAVLDGGVLISDDGVTQVTNPRNSGGWAQYGFEAEEQ